MAISDELLGNSGPPHEIRHTLADGQVKVYRARLIDNYVESAFAKRLLALAKDVARELRDLMTPEQYQAHLLKLNDDYIRGEYGMLSPRGLAMLGEQSGILLICELIFDAPAVELLGVFNSHKEEVASLIKLIIKESLPGVEFKPQDKNGQVGNAQAPAPTAVVAPG